MRQVKKWRYYCDHCRKGGCSKHHMASHEKHCIYNPDRECRMCVFATGEEGQTQPMRDLIEAFAEGDLDGLKKRAQHCPACILATIVQMAKAKKANGTWRPEEDYVNFDYKKARENMWAELNSCGGSGLP